MNEPPSSTPPEIDLYALHLLRQVARWRGFTAAAQACGLSQSALTRQVQGIEARLGIRVFDRTTRTVTLTEPGAVLLRETEAIPNLLSGAMRRIREEYLGGRREVRIGISRELTLAHIPGIFHAQRRLQPDVRIVVSQPEPPELLRLAATAALDLGILALPPEPLPATAVVTHRMEDRFAIVTEAALPGPPDATLPAFRKWAARQAWLLPPPGSTARGMIDGWSRRAKTPLPVAMELENFDLMIPLAAMGMGVAWIPRRALSTFPRKRQVRLLSPPVELSRELAVISPLHARSPKHVETFVRGILFS